MTTKDYDMSIKGKSLEETYNHFNKLYARTPHSELTQSMNVFGKDVSIYDTNNIAIILSKNSEFNNFFPNLTLIGSKNHINKTIKEIKQKGFLLEERVN